MNYPTKKEAGLAFMWLNHLIRSNIWSVSATGLLARGFLLAHFASPNRYKANGYWSYCQHTTIKMACFVLVINALGWFWKGIPDTIESIIFSWIILLWTRPWFVQQPKTAFNLGLMLWTLSTGTVIYFYYHHDSIIPGSLVTLISDVAFGFCIPFTSKFNWNPYITIILAWIGVTIEVTLEVLGAGQQFDSLITLGYLLPLCASQLTLQAPTQPWRQWISRHSLLLYGASLVPYLWQVKLR